jgi:ketosteroid isomerase-like protein
VPAEEAKRVAGQLIAAYAAADFATLRGLVADDLLVEITDADGTMLEVRGADEFIARNQAMNIPSASLSLQLTQEPVPVPPDSVLVMVEVHAERGGGRLHNFAAHLLRIGAERRIAEWRMVDAKPAESAEFWAA